MDSYHLLPKSSQIFWKYIMLSMIKKGDFTVDQMFDILSNLVQKGGEVDESQNQETW